MCNQKCIRTYNYPPEQGRPLLDYAICSNRLVNNIPNRPKIVALLLDYGAWPNEVYKGTTPWKNALSHLSKSHWQFTTGIDSNTSLELSVWMEFITLLITCKADPNASCVQEGGNSGPKRSALKTVRNSFGQRFPAQAANIKHLLLARGAVDDAPTPCQVMFSRYVKQYPELKPPPTPKDPELQPLISTTIHKDPGLQSLLSAPKSFYCNGK